MRYAALRCLRRAQIGPVYVAVIVMAMFIGLLMVLLNCNTFGQRDFAVGGIEEAAVISGIRADRSKIVVFGIVGFAAGSPPLSPYRGCLSANLTASGGLGLQTIAAVIIVSTTIRTAQTPSGS